MIEIFDFETTDIFEPKVTQIGKCRLDKSMSLIKSSCLSRYVNPEKPISWGAMGVTGITNEMVSDKPIFEEVLPKFSIHKNTKYLVCHNTSFDIKLFPEGFIPEGVKVLCTLKLAKALLDKKDCDNHQNTTLFYYLGCYKNPLGKEHIEKSHDALSDVLMTANVLTQLLEQHDLTIEEAWNFLYDPTCVKGGKKYEKGTPWEHVIKKDIDYVEHTLENVDLDQEEKDYLEMLLERYSHLKHEQVLKCSKAKYAGQEWLYVLEKDRSYMQFLVDKEYLKGLELDYVTGLLRGENIFSEDFSEEG